MGIAETQLPEKYRNVISTQIEIFNQGTTVTDQNSIPDTTQIPIDDPRHWLKIPNVICVYVDMKSSTKLSASTKEKSTSGAYQLFTSTAVRLFDAFDTPYIDVRGDGVFALFNDGQHYRALASAVTFRTFSERIFEPNIRKSSSVDVGCHIGIDQKTVLVKKIGMRMTNGRSDRQNEVWAGKPVNMASKLASIGELNEILVSDRFYNKLKDIHALISCGCKDGQPGTEKKELWTTRDLSSDLKFDFDKCLSLKSEWCVNHGKEYCEHLLRLEK